MKKRKKKTKRWIQGALRKHKRGALHKQLGIPVGEVIPIRRLESASKRPGLLGKRARLAMNLRKIRRKK